MSRTPDRTELLELVQQQLQDRIHTVKPAKVVLFHSSPGTPSADVLPVPYDRDGSGVALPTPQVVRAPILYPGGGGWSITWPLAPGDDVTLLIADRAIDQYRRTGLPGDPQSGRRHALTDAMVYPGGWTDAGPATVSPTELTIRGPTGATITISATGEVKLTGLAGASLTVTAAGAVELASASSIKLGAPSVTLQAGAALGSFLTTLHAAMTAWVPVPNDGGAALKTALATWLAQTPPS